MKRRPPRSTRTDTLFPYTTLFRSLQDVEVRIVDTAGGPMVVTHLIVDTRDAMGANAVNSMAEKLAPHIESWTGGRVYLRILSNLADRRLARARAVWTRSEEHTSELQSLMPISYAVLCLKKKIRQKRKKTKN